MQNLSALSDVLVGAVEAGAPLVVRVEARRRVAASGIIWSADGAVVTADHAVHHDEHIRVGLPDGSAVAATLAGRDPGTDLAVLRLEAGGGSLPEARWTEPDTLRVGQLALALARPGRTLRASLGIISAVEEGRRTRSGGRLDRYVHTDAAMHPGFSGGPLIDPAGRLIGLNTTGLSRGQSVTITAPTLRRVAGALLAHGRIRRGYLGIGAQPVRLPSAATGQAGQEVGLLLLSVEPGSPAEQAGLVLGDAILTVNGQPTLHHGDLLAALGEERIGAALAVRVLRAGSVRDISVVVGERQ